MVEFELSEEQRIIRDTVVSFAREQIRPAAREADEKGEVRGEVLQQAWELGLPQSFVPEEFGGFGNERSVVTGAIMAEELAWADLSTALAIMAPRLLLVPVCELGSAEQKKRYLPPFCGDRYVSASAAVVEPRFDFDVGTPATTAFRDGDGYVLNGEKCYVPLAATSSHVVVLASAENGSESQPALFVVERDAPGVRIGERERLMGIKALATSRFSLENCRVDRSSRLGADERGAVSRFLNLSRVALAAMAVGVARAAYEYARDYAKERQAFGVYIAQKQAIAFMLAEMAIEVDATRLMVWRAAWKLDRGEDATREACIAKRYAAEMAVRIGDNAVQILGGHGYIRDHLVELFLRNARGFAAFEGMAVL